MSKHDDGGHAYPIIQERMNIDAGGPGMTLLDYHTRGALDVAHRIVDRWQATQTSRQGHEEAVVRCAARIAAAMVVEKRRREAD